MTETKILIRLWGFGIILIVLACFFIDRPVADFVHFQGNDSAGSFPSGHSTTAFACLLPIGLYYRRLLWACILLAGLEALSMVTFDYHFVSDLIAGACLGATCALYPATV